MQHNLTSKCIYRTQCFNSCFCEPIFARVVSGKCNPGGTSVHVHLSGKFHILQDITYMVDTGECMCLYYYGVCYRTFWRILAPSLCSGQRVDNFSRTSHASRCRTRLQGMVLASNWGAPSYTRHSCLGMSAVRVFRLVLGL